MSDLTARNNARRASEPSADDTLAEVFLEVREGSEEAFAQLYDMTSSRLYGVVLRVVRAPDLAVEITQEVYVEVWRQAARWESEKGSVRAWMHTIAHRRAVDRVRSTQKETERETRWAGQDRTTEVDHTWDGVEQKLDAEGVQSALKGLSDVQKEAVTLAYYGGYSQREVAEILGIPLGTVKTRIRDGLSGLRSVMGVKT